MSSNERLSRRWAVTLWRSLDRLHRAIKDCGRIGFQESSPITNAHHADIWNALNEAQKDAALKLDVFSKGLPVETAGKWVRLSTEDIPQNTPVTMRRTGSPQIPMWEVWQPLEPSEHLGTDAT